MTAHTRARLGYRPEIGGDVAAEASIVWLRNPASCGPWVREELGYSVHRRRRFALPRSAIAFATIRTDAPREAPGNGWYRRFWWVKPDDRQMYDEWPAYPYEAVNPLSIRAGELSELPAPKPWPPELEAD